MYPVMVQIKEWIWIKKENQINFSDLIVVV